MLRAELSRLSSFLLSRNLSDFLFVADEDENNEIPAFMTWVPRLQKINRELRKWSNILMTDPMQDNQIIKKTQQSLSESTEEQMIIDEWFIITVLIHATLLFSSVISKHYSAIEWILSNKFQQRLPPLYFPESNHNIYERDNSGDDDSDDSDDSDDTDDSDEHDVTAAEASLKKDFQLLEREIMIYRVLHHFEDNIHQSVGHTIESSDFDRGIQDFRHSLRSCLDIYVSQIINHFKEILGEMIATRKQSISDLEGVDDLSEDDEDYISAPIREQLSKFSIKECLKPWNSCPFTLNSGSNSLWNYLKLSSLFPRISKTIHRFIECNWSIPSEETDKFFDEPMDIFKVADQKALPRAITVNSLDDRFIAIASAFGIREINVVDILTCRSKSSNEKEYKLATELNQDVFTWQGSTRQFKISDEDMSEFGSLLFPQPVRVLCATLGLEIPEQSRDMKPANSVDITKIYDDFIGISFREMCSRTQNSQINRNQVVTSLASHPYLPLYLSSNVQGQIFLWHFGMPGALAEFTFKIQKSSSSLTSSTNKTHITKVRFNASGTRFGATSSSGMLSLWSFHYQRHSKSHLQTAYELFQVHDKQATDFVFLNGGSLMATSGDSSDGYNVRLWDATLGKSDRLTHSFKFEEGAKCTALCYIQSSNLLVTGWSKGQIAIYNLHTDQRVHTIDEYTKYGRVDYICFDPWAFTIYSGHSEGALIGFTASTFEKYKEWPSIYKKERFFNHPSAYVGQDFGVTDITVSGQHVYTAGSDGSVKHLRKKYNSDVMQRHI